MKNAVFALALWVALPVWAMSANELATLYVEIAQKECGAAFKEYPTIGMTEAQFKKCTEFGIRVKPTTVNETETAAGVSKQYVYSADWEIRYLYVRKGVVTAIQR